VICVEFKLTSGKIRIEEHMYGRLSLHFSHVEVVNKAR
jgi:hypothetical protein